MVGVFPLSRKSDGFYVLLPLCLRRSLNEMPTAPPPDHLLCSCTVFCSSPVLLLPQGSKNHLFSRQRQDDIRGTCSIILRALSNPAQSLLSQRRAHFPEESHTRAHAAVYLLPILFSLKNTKLVLQNSQPLSLAGA